jgi:phosphatidylglycerophosphate synthase
MGFLSKKGLKSMSETQCKLHTNSYLDDLLNFLIWEPFLRILPVWVAPNLLSLLGSAVIVASALYTISFNSSAFTEDPPLWIWPVAASSVFLFEMVDSLDGKQARRTNSTTPLGQFFDYGSPYTGLDTCFNINAVWILLVHALHLHQSFYAPLLLILLHLPSYLASWEEYHCGVLRLTQHNLGATEFLLAVKAILLVTYFGGYELWDTEVFHGLRLSHSLVVAVVYMYALCSFCWTVPNNLAAVLLIVRSFAPIAQLFPLMIISLSLIGLVASPTYSSNACGVLLSTASLLSLLSSKMFVCSTAKQPFNSVTTELMLYECLLLLTWYYGTEPVPPNLVWLVAGLMCLMSVSFFWDIARSLARHLGLSLFRIKH